jgi:hypothetical protein
VAQSQRPPIGQPSSRGDEFFKLSAACRFSEAGRQVRKPINLTDAQPRSCSNTGLYGLPMSCAALHLFFRVAAQLSGLAQRFLADRFQAMSGPDRRF